MSEDKTFAQHFYSVISNPSLWTNTLAGIQQYPLSVFKKIPNQLSISSKRRLGHVVEELLLAHFQASNINCLRNNIQVVENKRSIGEIDYLILDDESRPYHVEAAFKFYLWDDLANPKVMPKSLSKAEITALAPWIGPNRRDSLLQKIDKLTEKQFPLLYHEATLPYLKEVNLKAEDLLQSVIFKAQLFVPLDFDFEKMPSFELLNKNCIKGIYLKKEQLNRFQECQFYIPNKIDWLLEPQDNVSWLSIEEFHEELSIHFSRQNAPLVWMKNLDDQLQKMIVVWW